MENDFIKICPVKQVIAKLGMSKARFYQHLKKGVFPPPIYCIRTKQPFYPDNLQQQCIDIRRTGIGHNGIPVIFYSPRERETDKSKEQPNHDYREIIEALKNIKIKVTNKEIEAALNELNITNITKDTISSEVIPKLVNYFTQRVKLGSNSNPIVVSKGSN